MPETGDKGTEWSIAGTNITRILDFLGEIRIMKIYRQRFPGRYGLHVLFLIGLFILLGIMIRRKPAHLVMEGWVSAVFMVLCVYSGRWIVRKRSVLMAAGFMVSLSLIAAIIWTRLFARDTYFHSEVFSVIIPVVAFLLGTGMLGAVLSAFWKRETAFAPVLTEKAAADHIFIKPGGKIFKLSFSDLLYAEASRNYTNAVMTGQTFNIPMSFSSFEKLLPVSQFIRVHRSFIVSKSKIGRIEGKRVFIWDKEIPIGDNYREEFFRKIGLDQK